MIAEKIQEILKQHAELETELSQPETARDPTKMEKLGREYNSIKKKPARIQEISRHGQIDRRG